MIKDVLVNLGVGKSRDAAGDFAISIAQMFDAHLTARAVACKLPVGGSVLDGVTADIVDGCTAQRKAAASQAKQSFDDRARLASIRADSGLLIDYVAEVAQIFAGAARHYDLSVVGQPEPENDLPESLINEAALFDSGRPVLIVPYIQKTGIKLDRVMLCWDGSRNAARAVGDAMPFLQRTGKISIVTIESTEQRNMIRGTQIAEHLARHELKVDLMPIVAPDSEVANVILSQAADMDTDLIVMGGYGHTRLREFVLGGATRDMLKSMTVPVLMSH
ncbi:universal stress protein [Rhodoplanes sp. Z2-YC6860]|uniref:universal stress protein n=1 Tax=Rhodoplanes sp. Z2-YC6860 TaxID=674703 RepID=UPI00078E9A80|nr:universal stress protein [Rhodoplanes sp. Z2-YC6860]AMN38516.1 UspA domain-containing protein [Rhodoplanes sp. Z2-YC6860]